MKMVVVTMMMISSEPDSSVAALELYIYLEYDFALHPRPRA